VLFKEYKMRQVGDTCGHIFLNVGYFTVFVVQDVGADNNNTIDIFNNTGARWNIINPPPPCSLGFPTDINTDWSYRFTLRVSNTIGANNGSRFSGSLGWITAICSGYVSDFSFYIAQEVNNMVTEV